MNEQFVQLMAVQQAQQKQITEILQLLSCSLTTQRSTECAVTSQTSEQTLFNRFSCEKFSAETCRVEEFVEYFEEKCRIHCIIEDATKKNLLFSNVSAEVYNELKIALIPNFDKSTYIDIRNKLLDLFRIKKTRYRALTDFWNCIRDKNETMEHYANRLKKIIKDCGYNIEQLERQLRDRFATGLNHTQLETDLKQKWPDLQELNNGSTREITFSEIFAVAQSREQAENDTITFSSTSNAVNKVDREKRKRHISKAYRPRKLYSHQCLRCGHSTKHDHSICSGIKHVCSACNKTGHIESCCITSGKAIIAFAKPKRPVMKLTKRQANTYNTSESNYDSSDEEESNVFKISKRNCKQVDCKINNINCTMDWDPGSSYSIINTTFWRQIGSPDLIRSPKLKAYGNNKLKTKGITDVSVELEGVTKILPVIVMKNANPMLFGLQWSEIFDMPFPKQVYSIKDEKTNTLQEILSNYSDLFDGRLGKVRDYEVNIHVKPDAAPVHLPARQIKFSIRKNIEAELERLTAEGIIQEVDPNIIPVEWATPTVNVVKPSGQIRICGDFRCTLNPVLTKHLHPVPIFDQLRQTLSKGDIFSKIDLKDAYLQFPIAPESKKYVTISTHKGYYQYNRMPFGISTAPSIFQHYLDKLLGDIPGVAVYFDDIAITGKDQKDHLRTLSNVFQRLQKAGLKVNLKKCSFLQKEIEYLGHIINEKGIVPSPSKIEAIVKAPTPTNVKELRSFLGLVNYYERFIPHLHGFCADLHAITSERRRWHWSEHETKIFQKIKSHIVKSQPLVAFDENRPLFLACDASEKGLGAVIYHKRGNIEEPIAFASRKLRPAEIKYSVIDREALAILYGVTKFDQYLRGTSFTLVTDHKPLIHILGPRRNLPKIVNNRLVRWALLIGSYSYEIVYQKGKHNLLADCLSRLPNNDEHPSDLERAVHRIVIKLIGTHIEDLNLSEDLIKQRTSKDSILRKVIQYIRFGWRDLNLEDTMKHFYRKRDELSVENGIVMWQGRMVIPQTLQRSVLKYLHRGHPGISSMRALSRFYVWWPSMEEQIETFVKTCTRCQQNRPHSQELPVFNWSLPENVWERVHIDFAGPFKGSYWFVLCDAFSKWIEVKPMKNITTRNTCKVLNEIFSTFGVPQMIVSDNGPQFTSSEFEDYCKTQGILHIRSSPYHPRTNGLAERLVRTFKTRMASENNEVLPSRLHEFLFNYRNTPHSTTGKAPSEIMFGRRLNCLLSNIRPNPRQKLNYQRVKETIENYNARHEPNYHLNDKVYVRTKIDKTWKPAIIKERKHKYSYIVATPNGDKLRHADHIRPRFSTSSPTTTTSNTQDITPDNLTTLHKTAIPLTRIPNANTTPDMFTSFLNNATTPSTTTTPATTTRHSIKITPTIATTPSITVTPSTSFSDQTQNTETPTILQPRRSTRVKRQPRRLIEEM